jgi:hypothetical protein
MAATIDFGSILNSVADVVLEFLNINDVPAGDGEYSFLCPKELKDGEDPYIWVKPVDGRKKFKASMGQLASMRVFTGESKNITSDYTKEFRELPLASNFQDQSAGKDAAWMTNVRLVCVRQLMVLNQSLSGKDNTPVYKRASYKGLDDYNAGLEKLKEKHGVDWLKTIDGRIALKGLRVTLEQSGLKAGVADTDRVLIPVFILK